MNELQIWKNIKNSDIESLKELYDVYRQALFNDGKKMTKDQRLIEDAIQEAFISIWKYRQASSVPIAVKQYVFMVFRNQLFQIFKDRSSTTYTGYFFWKNPSTGENTVSSPNVPAAAWCTLLN